METAKNCLIIAGTNRELSYFCCSQLYNCKQMLVTSPFLMRTYDANYFLSFIDQETVDLFFSIIKRIQNMHLSDLERALVAPMIVMQSGRLARLSPFFLLFQEMSRSNH